MTKKKWKPIIGAFTAALLMTTAVWPLHAQGPTQDLDNALEENQEADTSVEATVSDQTPGSPTYVIRIPSVIDFGLLKAPATDTNSFKDIPFAVELVSISGVERGSAVCVLVRDGKTPPGLQRPTSDFTLNKANLELVYSVFNGSADPDSGTNLFERGRWYENGYLFGLFDHNEIPGSSLPGALRLNQRALFGKDLSEYSGNYSGTMHFYSKIGNRDDQ